MPKVVYEDEERVRKAIRLYKKKRQGVPTATDFDRYLK